MTETVAFITGSPEHGVVRHARVLAAQGGWRVVDRVDEVAAGSWVVLDVTDRLWGETADRSGPALAAVLDGLNRRGARVAAALHDVPFDGDGAVFTRRAAVYRSIVQRSAAVFVCSEVERGRLAALTPHAPPTRVSPLPVEHAAGRSDDAGVAAPTSVTVLGFLYPGKGHDEVLAAMAALPPDIPLVCVGRPADGHDDLVDALVSDVRSVQVTGWVPDPELPRWLHAATIPVAPNRVVSASGSIATWWAYGRRPLAADTAYTREIGTDASLAFYDRDLGAALSRAFDEPASTWLRGGGAVGRSAGDVVADRSAWLSSLSA